MKLFPIQQKLILHMNTHQIDYKNTRKSPKVGEDRKTRKDKGIGRSNYRKLLSGVGQMQIDDDFSTDEEDVVYGTRKYLESSSVMKAQMKKLYDRASRGENKVVVRNE